MADLKSQIARHEAWYSLSNTRLLVSNYFPCPLPCDGLDFDVPVAAIAERKLRNAAARHAAGALQDGLVVAHVDFSTAFYPALAGAGYRYDEHTSWTLPVAKRAADIRINAFDPGHPLYVAYQQRLEALLKAWSWHTFLPVPAGFSGPIDILAGFLGPEALSLELYDSPAAVRAAAEAAADFLCAAIAHEKTLFCSAGFAGGMATLFGTWQPGWCGLYVEDFSALLGPEHYREFFLELDARVIGEFDSVLFHTHSAGYRSIAPMLELPRHVALELGNDPGGPDTEARIATALSILQDGRPLLMGSWEVPLPEAEMSRIVQSLPAQGLHLRFQCDSAEHAQQLYDGMVGSGRHSTHRS